MSSQQDKISCIKMATNQRMARVSSVAIHLVLVVVLVANYCISPSEQSSIFSTNDLYQNQYLQHHPTSPNHTSLTDCHHKPNFCKNGATCQKKPDASNSYQCSCVNGWTGPDCSEEVDDCSPNPCLNGAKCHDRVGQYICECPPGKIGLLCQLTDACFFKNPCHPNATCDTTVEGEATCICPSGFDGPNCNMDIDECLAGSPCEHGGSCVNTLGSFRCDCPRGFTGARCEVNVNECENNPCLNEGTCLDERGDFKCICAPGFAGQRCETDINECASNPCRNNATCIDLVNSFQCHCQDNYFGDLCEQTVLSPGNPWAKCAKAFDCWTRFKNGRCDPECDSAECLYDGYDCLPASVDMPTNNQLPNDMTPKSCDVSGDSDSYCLKNYANNICDQECNNAGCGWDGSDCELTYSRGELPPANTLAQGLLVIRVQPAIDIPSANSEPGLNIELAKLLRKVSVATKTILKIQNFRQLSSDEGNGTEIELIADNRYCRASCYNSTELIAKFLTALKIRVKNDPGSLAITATSKEQPGIFHSNQQPASALYIIICGTLATVCALLMMISIGKQKVKEKAVVWFPEGFKPVLSTRNRDPTDRKPGRGISTLQALGGNFFRGIKRNERHISTDPRGMHNTDVDRCATSTPNGSGIYHEPYDQYDQYGTYGGTDSSSMINGNVDEPLTPTPLPLNPINMEGPQGMTPLMVAAMGVPFSKEPLGLVAYGTTGEMTGSVDNNVTDLLQRGAQLSHANKVTGETALHLAARHGRVDAARGLLERCDSQDVNAQDATGRTPLHAAIAADSQGVFELLIRCRGTDLNAQTLDGTTPLILATRVGTFSMLEELILNECEVTKSDSTGKTALHWAAATNNVDAIRRLLQVRETNKDAQDMLEETPLFLAAREGAKGAVEILLNHNANKELRDQMERSPEDIARSRQHHDIVRLLEQPQVPQTPRTPRTPKSIASIHHSSRQLSPISPQADSNSNSNISTTQPPPPGYHVHSQSAGAGCYNVVYNVPNACLKNFPTPSPDSNFTFDSSMASPIAFNEQYQNHPSMTTSRGKAGVYI